MISCLFLSLKCISEDYYFKCQNLVGSLPTPSQGPWLHSRPTGLSPLCFWPRIPFQSPGPSDPAMSVSSSPQPCPAWLWTLPSLVGTTWGSRSQSILSPAFPCPCLAILGICLTRLVLLTTHDPDPHPEARVLTWFLPFLVIIIVWWFGLSPEPGSHSAACPARLARWDILFCSLSRKKQLAVSAPWH